MRLAAAVLVGICAAACAGPKSSVEYEQQTTETAPCVCADGCVRACPVDPEVETSYRKVVRDPEGDPVPHESPGEFELLDVAAGEALEGPSLIAAAESVNAKDRVIAGFRADLIRGRGEEFGLLYETGELVIYRDLKAFARLQLGSPSTVQPLQAVRLVDDRVELLVRHTEEGRQLVTVCRVIGKAVGRVFQSETAEHTVEFVHLGDERAIRVTRASEGPVVYRWNQWEGMFRQPGRVPTAPH